MLNYKLCMSRIRGMTNYVIYNFTLKQLIGSLGAVSYTLFDYTCNINTMSCRLLRSAVHYIVVEDYTIRGGSGRLRHTYL